MSCRWVLWVACVVLFFVSGCDGKKKLATVPVSGTVTYNGQPVSDANVSFFPVDPLSGKPALGTTDAGGKFTLQTAVGGTTMSPGALVGDYNVAVSKVKASVPTAVPNTPEAQIKITDEMKTSPPPIPEPESLLPKKYADPSTSNLKESVKDGKNDFTFDLKDD